MRVRVSPWGPNDDPELFLTARDFFYISRIWMRASFTGVRMSSPACALGEYAHESFFVDVCLFRSAGY